MEPSSQLSTPGRVFVTGGTGFLGHSLLPRLVQHGFAVRVLTRHPQDFPWLRDLGVDVVAGDILDARLVGDSVRGCDYVIHAAGRFSFWGKRELFERTNVQGAANIMDAAVAARVRRFVHISTIVVVGNPLPDRVVDETHPTQPVDPYQISKLKGEQLALAHYRDHGLPVVILRPGAFYGPYGRYAFNRLFFEDPFKGLLIQVNNGSLITFPAYTGDVADSAIAAIRRGEPGEIYNICGETLTHHQANDIVSEEAGITRFRINVPRWSMVALASVWTALSEYTGIEPYYPLNLRSYVFNNWRVSSAKAKEKLGFQPVPFREGVRLTLDWYREAGIWKGRS
ncbi:MAG TPA: NAD-dependent epimerase/dehydratase family protein [Aggregatilineales bacterium]|nr:NAD-dependent epimerase/dehydratase family protein [Aggregatilineales bacterium]